MNVVPLATKIAKAGALVGLLCGVVYSVGGCVVDLTTVGLNGGTALAFLALLGMPLLFAAFGFVIGAVLAVLLKVAGKSGPE